MKREIKFRGWDKHNKSMVNLLSIGYAGCVTLGGWGDQYGGMEQSKTLVGYYKSDGSIDEALYETHEEYEFMQYTGLKDNGGTEIYEGDIVDRIGTNKSIGIITWYKDHACFGVSYVVDGRIIREYIKDNYNGYFVIGNIYENPELIE